MSKANKHQDYDRKLEIDGDPVEDRTTEHGHFRAMLNARERRVLKERQQMGQVIEKLMANVEMPQIAEELGMDLGEMSSALLFDEGQEIREMILQKVIDRILDLDTARTRAQIGREIGLTKYQLDKIIASDDFKQLYADTFVKIRSDPNIELVQQKVIEDLLPAAFRSLRLELEPGAPWTVRQRARQDIFKLAGIEAQQHQNSDRAEANKFLSQWNITLNFEKGGGSVPIPEEYQQAFQDTLPPIEGEVREASGEETAALLPDPDTSEEGPDR